MRHTIYISEKAHPLLLAYLQEKDAIIHRITDRIGSRIGTHADLYYCQMGSVLFPEPLTGGRSAEESNVFHGNAELLQPGYPGDCLFNAACTGKFFIHNTKITDSGLLAAAKNVCPAIIDVKQGYAKCSCVVVDENSIITSDAGIAKKCDAYNGSVRGISESERINCLLVSPGNIILDGFEYGFIGGASGRFGDEIIFNGDLSAHPDHKIITEFIEERGLKIRCFEQYPLTDIGSIIVESVC